MPADKHVAIAELLAEDFRVALLEQMDEIEDEVQATDASPAFMAQVVFKQKGESVTAVFTWDRKRVKPDPIEHKLGFDGGQLVLL